MQRSFFNGNPVAAKDCIHGGRNPPELQTGITDDPSQELTFQEAFRLAGMMKDSTVLTITFPEALIRAQGGEEV